MGSLLCVLGRMAVRLADSTSTTGDGGSDVADDQRCDGSGTAGPEETGTERRHRGSLSPQQPGHCTHDERHRHQNHGEGDLRDDAPFPPRGRARTRQRGLHDDQHTDGHSEERRTPRNPPCTQSGHPPTSFTPRPNRDPPRFGRSPQQRWAKRCRSVTHRGRRPHAAGGGRTYGSVS